MSLNPLGINRSTHIHLQGLESLRQILSAASDLSNILPCSTSRTESAIPKSAETSPRTLQGGKSENTRRIPFDDEGHGGIA